MQEIQSPKDLRKWLEQLPTASMVYPEKFSEKVKYYFWRIITPFHPYVRDTLTFFGLLRHNFRQDFLIGMLSPQQSIKEFVAYLIGLGYGIHFIAWRDTGEIVSLRYVDTFTHQYHIRIFDDGEVRAHYEYTPEYHPILHMKETGMVDMREYFLKLLGDRIIPV